MNKEASPRLHYQDEIKHSLIQTSSLRGASPTADLQLDATSNLQKDRSSFDKQGGKGKETFFAYFIIINSLLGSTDSLSAA